MLVDSTVWVDFFRGLENPETRLLEAAIKSGAPIYTCGLVITELIQGCQTEREVQLVLSRIAVLKYLEPDFADYVRAAEIFRSLRARGITVRKTIDCILAALAIAHHLPLLHRDRDFDPIERHCGLIVVKNTQ